MSAKLKTVVGVIAVQLLLLLTISMVDLSPTAKEEPVPTILAARKSFPIDVRTTGELEAAHSISIASNIRTDQPKVIFVISDGSHVDKGNLLVKIDPSPYEKRVEELQGLITDAENQIALMEQTLAWEIDQAKHENKTAAFEIEAAELELSKIKYGDGPLEEARLRSAMLKAQIKYEELNNYADDLIALQNEGILDAIEVKQTQKKLEEEKENYENAKLQYESYVQHVQPMQIKKSETALKRIQNKQEESNRSSAYKIAKAEAALAQAEHQLIEYQRQLKEAQNELLLTEIKAPSSGMVVLKEDFRGTQRRKLRVGDTLVRNQAIIDLPDMTSMIVKTKVREIDLYKVDIGKPATIEIDAYPSLSLKGKVTFIGILALSDSIRPGDEKYFEVKITLDQVDPRLRPGMTSRVIIHAGHVDNAISVPIHSVFEMDKKHFCYKAIPGGAYIMQPVVTGMNNEQWVAIQSGLNENDQICLSMPPETLTFQSTDEPKN